MEMLLGIGQQKIEKANKVNLLQFLILRILLFLSAHPGSGPCMWTPRRLVSKLTWDADYLASQSVCKMVHWMWKEKCGNFNFCVF